MAKKELKSDSNRTFSLTEMKDKYIGKVGSINRDEYEYELHRMYWARWLNPPDKNVTSHKKNLVNV